MTIWSKDSKKSMLKMVGRLKPWVWWWRTTVRSVLIAVAYTCVIFFHMANLNNMFNSEDSMAFTITLLMTTKYITVNKGGSLHNETVVSVISSKLSDFTRDLILTLMIVLLGGQPSKSTVVKMAAYLLTLFCCICMLDSCRRAVLPLLQHQKRHRHFL